MSPAITYPLRQLSMMFNPPDRWIMAALIKTYLDDGGDKSLRAISVAGYVGSLKAWDRFEDEWGAVLERHEIPYFHMGEICDPKSPMHKFCGKANEAALAALLRDLAMALAVSSSAGRFVGIGGLVLLDDLKRFNRERGRGIEPMPLALFTCLALMQSLFPDQTIEGLLDQVTKAEKQIAIAQSYLATSPKAGGKDLVAIQPAKGDINSKTVRGLQAADFAAYETYKYEWRIRPFFESVDLSEIGSNLEYWYAHETWLGRTGKPSPYERPSLTALGNATKFTCPIWTYALLCDEDDMRKGKWAD